MIATCSVTGPCGHTTDFDLSCVGIDAYACAQCGNEWHIKQDPPIIHRSGWIEPGNRYVTAGLPVTKRTRRFMGRVRQKGGAQ